MFGDLGGELLQRDRDHRSRWLRRRRGRHFQRRRFHEWRLRAGRARFAADALDTGDGIAFAACLADMSGLPS